MNKYISTVSVNNGNKNLKTEIVHVKDADEKKIIEEAKIKLSKMAHEYNLNNLKIIKTIKQGGDGVGNG